MMQMKAIDETNINFDSIIPLTPEQTIKLKFYYKYSYKTDPYF